MSDENLSEQTPRKEENITIMDAYLAAFQFLKIHYKRFNSDEMGVVIGEMQIHSDGSTLDPAAWFDWLKCVDQAKMGDVDARLALTRDGKTWFHP